MGTVNASLPTASQTTVASTPGACDYQARMTRLSKRSLLPLCSLTPHSVYRAENPRGSQTRQRLEHGAATGQLPAA